MSGELRRQPNAGSAWVWVIAWAGSVLIVTIVPSIMFWCWLGIGESNSTTIRNLGLVIGATIGLPIAIWRSIVAERQADMAQRQYEIAQRGLLNERYQKGAEMLGSKELQVRLGGIYALAGLAREHPGDYHTQIMGLLCAFVRHPAGKPVEAALPTEGLTPAAEHDSGFESYDEDDYDASGQLREGVEVRPLRVREDVLAVMMEVGKRSEAQIKTEDREKYRLDLRDAKLKSAQLVDADLNHVNLPNADLTGAVLFGLKPKGANLRGANLENASLVGAHLKDVRLPDVNLEGAMLTSANLTRTFMAMCKGLTQEQLDGAVAELGNPPELGNLVDAKTGNKLVWIGGTPNG